MASTVDHQHLGAALIGGLSRRLPCRRWQAAYWLGKLLAPKGPFVGSFRGGRIEILPDDFASMQAFYLGFFEREVTMLCLEEIRQGPPSLILDAGANFGYYPLLFSLLSGGRTKAIAFEADPNNAARLTRNVRMNPGIDVIVENMAVGDKDDDAELFAAPDGHRVWSLLTDVPGKSDPGWQRVRIPMTTLDVYCDRAGIDSVPLTIIDVEGYEGKVVAGMARGLATHRYRKIMIELHRWALSIAEMEQLVAAIVDAGYDGYRIRHHPAAHPDKSVSYYDLRFDRSAVLGPLTLEALTDWEHLWFESRN
jgi:FkbM family methyltransferase